MADVRILVREADRLRTAIAFATARDQVQLAAALTGNLQRLQAQITRIQGGCCTSGT